MARAPSNPRKSSFPPVLPKRPRVLVLGTLPGEESLRQQQYYAHPRNAFWAVLAAAFDGEAPATYGARLALLRRHRIAVWDVLESAERSGSLDSAITDGKPNDIAALLHAHPSITHVLFNGTPASRLFRRFIAKDVALIRPQLTAIVLPSTSPAHAGRTVAQKAAAWRAALLSGAG